MDELSRLLADDVHAEQNHVAGAKISFNRPVSSPMICPRGVVLVARPAHDIGDALRLQRFLGFAHHARFRNGVDSGGQEGARSSLIELAGGKMAMRACSIPVAARAGGPTTSPAAYMCGTLER